MMVNAVNGTVYLYKKDTYVSGHETPGRKRQTLRLEGGVAVLERATMADQSLKK